MKWIDFKVEKPYNYQSNNGLEDDPQYCYVIYWYPKRPPTMNRGPFLSPNPMPFIDGVFKDYESPHLTDKIEILYWCDKKDVKFAIIDDFVNQIGMMVQKI